VNTQAQFLKIVERHGSTVTFHRETGGVDCPCLTPEGFRDPAWHLTHRPNQFPLPNAYNYYDGTNPSLAHLTVLWVGIPGAKNIQVADENGNNVYGTTGPTDAQGEAQMTFDATGIGTPTLMVKFSAAGQPAFQDYIVTSDVPIAGTDGQPFPSYINPPVCNAEGKLPVITEIPIKGFVQPAQSTRATRLSDEFIQQMFGTVRADDHFGILPLAWNGQTLDFSDWSQNGPDYILYHGRKFFIVNANIIPDPANGADHHAEVGLRVLNG
jgi:hypothetical protein